MTGSVLAVAQVDAAGLGTNLALNHAICAADMSLTLTHRKVDLKMMA